MRILDDHGRLFGIINVIDLLAVLFALAVVVAGVALVFSGGSTEQPDLGTRYVTLDLGKQPGYVTERVSTGDVAPATNGPGNLTITDVYVTPAGDGTSTVTVRALVSGELQQGDRDRPVFRFGGSPLILGREVTVETADYRATGTVTALEREGDTLDVSTTEVVVSTMMPADIAATVSVGDEYRANGRTLATVESKTVYPTDDPTDHRVHLGLSLRTISSQGRPQFGGQEIGLGRSIDVPIGPYDVNGQVTHMGRTSLLGDVTSTTVVLELSNVAPERAANIRAGLTETVGDTQYAEIVSVRSEPSEVVLTSDDGNISLHEHPRNLDLYLTVELRTRQRESGLRFHGAPVRLNERVVLDFDFLTVRGVLIEVRQ